MRGGDKIWVDIPGYKFCYRINEDGVVQKLNGDKWVNLTPMLSSTRAEVNIRTKDGARHKVPIVRLMANAFFGGQPHGKAIVHKNGSKLDNSLWNLKVVSRGEAARLSNGPKRRSIEKVDKDGNVIELYRSQAAAAKANYISKNAVSDRCRNKLKDPYALTGFTFRYEKIKG